MIKARILHIGDAIKHNPKVYDRLAAQFDFVRPSAEERQRDQFMEALKEQRWGDFHAIFRPFWNTGGEMGLRKCWRRADVDTLAEHGILYCNGAAASSEAVADMAIYHIISVFRNMQWSQSAAKSLDPDQWLEAHRYATTTAHNPRGNVLGIIGLDNIGYTIAKKAYACFGMKIHYQDLCRKTSEQEAAIEAVYHESLNELLGVSDCVILATPFSGEALISSTVLAKFKKGSRLVNIARGSLVDEEALVSALESGHLFAAGLDVHANEPHVHPELAAMRQVNLTCHNAEGAIETNIGFGRLAMENIECVLTGKEALSAVHKHLLKAN